MCYRITSLMMRRNPLGPYSTPIYSPRVVLAGMGGIVMSEVPLFPQRPKRAATVPCGYMSSRLPSDMPSTPAALASPLASAEGLRFKVS